MGLPNSITVSSALARGARYEGLLAVARMTRLVDRMLTLAKADSGLKLQLGAMDLPP